MLRHSDRSKAHRPATCAIFIPAILGMAAPVLAGPAPIGPFSISVQSSGSELVQLKALAEETGAVLNSPEFRANALLLGKGTPGIYVGSGYQEAGKPATLASPDGLLKLLSPMGAPYRPHPMTVTLTGTYYAMGAPFTGTCTAPTGETRRCATAAFTQNASNMSAVTHGIGLYQDGAEIASIEIGRQIFKRYQSDTLAKRSCMINTLAHEWTHGFGKQSNHWAVVEDTINGQLPQTPAGYPIASYFIGTVAQCTWLQQKGAVAAGEAALKACSTQYGLSDFKSLQCD